MQVVKDIFIKKGSLFIYRVFDIAEEVNLHSVEEIFRKQSGTFRLRLADKSRDAVIVRNAPVRVNLGEVKLLEDDEHLKKADLVATVWDYGALSLAFQIPLQTGLPWKDLLNLAAFLNSDTRFLAAIDGIAKAKSVEFSELVKPALHKPRVWDVFEDYILYFFEEIQGLKRAEDLVHDVNLPALLLGEPKESLSALTRESIIQNLFQYAENDLVLIDWNSAVVLEPTGQRDIPDVLEFALTHLLEVRYYDELLDQRLTEIYDSVGDDRSRLFQNRYGRISKEANSRFIEFAEFMERMGNSLKVVGDFYLARIFRGAIRRFRISDWEENITRKMNLLARVSDLLQGETNIRRSHWLEGIIIMLILFEIISAFVGH